jgi:hypothetical protein
MEPQVALIDRDIWPDSRHQLLLADNFAGAFDKNDKNVERSSTQMNWAARLLKVSVRWEQAKWTERNKVRSRSGLFVSHLHSLNIFGGRFASRPSSPRSAGPAARMRPPIQDTSTRGMLVFIRSHLMTDPSGWAASHCSTNLAVSVKIEPSKRGLTSIASNVSTLLSSVPQSFSVNFGLIYFMGERHNPSAPDVTRR